MYLSGEFLVMNRKLNSFLLFTSFILAFSFTAQAQKSIQQEQVDSEELRLYMDAFFGHFSGIVEEAADSIKRSTDDDQVKANTLMWKMNAIPVAQRTIFTTNPIVALLDANVLCIQMDHFFKDGKGQTMFGEHQNIAQVASQYLRHYVNQILNQYLDGSLQSKAVEEIQFFALNHPIQSIYFNRASTKPLMAKVFGENSNRFKDVAQDMNQSIKDLNNRINFITDLLPKQIRWQSEYLMYDVTPENVKVLEKLPLDTLIWQLDSITTLAYTIPGLVDNQRALVFEYISQEREQMTKLLQAERQLAFRTLQNERALVLQELTSQRNAAFQETDQIIDKSIDKTFLESKEIVDYLVWRVIFMLMGTFIAIAILIVLYKKL